VNRPVLVVGVPRSGTTWVARTLAQGCGAAYLEEPDNHFRFAAAYRAKHALGRRGTPAIQRDDADRRLTGLAALWKAAFVPARESRVAGARRRAADRLLTHVGPLRVDAALAGGREGVLLAAAASLGGPQRLERSGPRIVKSVYAPLCAEWLADRYDVPVVVVQRTPINIVSSWLELGWLEATEPDPLASLSPETLAALSERYGDPPLPATRLGQAALLIGLLTCALEDAVAANPAWQRVVHEDLAGAAHGGFRALAGATGLVWSERGDELLERSNRPGAGYELARVAADLPHAWKARLDERQAAEARAIVSALPLPSALRA
jgi:hypothetical protein